MGYQAFALAPVVQRVPNAVITDDPADVSAAFTFVYADFVNLNNYVSDDGDIANIIWSWSNSGALTRAYAINGSGPHTGVADAVAPPANSIINSATNIATHPAFAGAGSEINPDANVNTPTLRDTVLSPYGGPNVDPGGVDGQVLAQQSILLWASDGTLATSTSQPTILYTMYRGGAGASTDHLSSTPAPTPVSVQAQSFATATNNWVQGFVLGSTTMASGAGGLCATVTATGGNIGEWVSPFSIMPLVNNAAYRIRLNMSTTQTTLDRGPLWDLYLRNLNYDPSTGTPIGPPTGDDCYVADYYFLDHTDSANRIGSAPGLTQFDIWFTPSPVASPRWQSTTSGIYTAAIGSGRDMRMIFRVIDSDSAGIGGELDFGQVCMTGITIDRFDLSNLYVTGNAEVYNLNPIISGINGVKVVDLLTQFGITSGAGSNKDFSTAPLTVTPADPLGWLTEITSILPGDNNDPPANDPAYINSNGAVSIDNWPIVWESNVLYQLLVGVSAPDVTAESNGPDSLRLGFEAKSAELFADSYMLSGFPNADTDITNPGMPKRTTAQANNPPSGPALGIQTYMMFFWSHNKSLSTTPEIARIRPKVEILNTTSYNHWTGSPLRNLGGIRIHSINVRKVHFFGE
jgi:hypothetical protein